MNRAIPLLVAIAAVGGGLAFFALNMGPAGTGSGSTDDGLAPVTLPTGPEREASSVKPEASPTTLATINTIERTDDPAPGGRSKSWEITPMNSVGQRVDSASVVAVPSEGVRGTKMTATGRTTWPDVPAGRWTLTVSTD